MTTWASFRFLIPLLLIASAPALHAQDDGSILTIPGLNSVAPDTSSKDREFYGAPSRAYSDKALTGPNVSTKPPATGDFAITVRTNLLNRFAGDPRVEQDNVALRVMEADVRGVQTTVTNVALESTDNSQMVRVNVIAQGTVNSNTVGFTPQARITTAGNHTFNITKPIFFDGRQFLTKAAYGGLQVRQVPQAVNTIASGVPLFGQIGEQIAWREVYRRMPASDSIVARHVADEVFPKVNSAVDDNLRKLNRQWQQLQQELKFFIGQDDVEWTARSSTNSFTTMAVNRAVARGRTVSGSSLPAELDPIEASAVLVSQDGANHVIGKLPFAGQTVSDTTLQNLVVALKDSDRSLTEIKRFLLTLDELEADPLLFSLTFAETDPLTIMFRDGLLQLHAKFRVLPKLGSASQMQSMKFRIGGKTTTDGKWSLIVRDIAVEPASSNELPDAWTKLIKDQATSMVDNIPPTELPRQIDLRRFDDRIPLMRIHRIQSTGGQLRVSFKNEDSATVTTNKLPW